MALLCPTAAKALVSPTETSLRVLLEEYSLDSGTGLLASLMTLQSNLDGFSIGCEPPIGLGDLDDNRVLSAVLADSTQSVMRMIGEGEKQDVEFKSSMLLDLRRYRKEPGEPLTAYKLEAVTRSLMKTIAAFCNSGGGTLFVGIEDDTSLCGMNLDYRLADSRRGDFDGWDQCLRGHIESLFFDGRIVSNYVRAMPFEWEGQTFIRIQVADRANLTFLKKSGGGAELFVRSGTRSVKIEYHEIEKHYGMKRQF